MLVVTAAPRLSAQTPTPSPTAAPLQTCQPERPDFSCPHSTVTYPPGWNLIGITSGSILTDTDGPPYTLHPGESNYEAVAPDGPIFTTGYWAHFSRTTTETLYDGDPIPPPCMAPRLGETVPPCPWPAS